MVSGVKTYRAFHISKYIVQFFLHRGVQVCIAKIRASGRTSPPSTRSVRSSVVLILCMVGSVVYSISVFRYRERVRTLAPPWISFPPPHGSSLKDEIWGVRPIPASRWKPLASTVWIQEWNLEELVFGCLSWPQLVRWVRREVQESWKVKVLEAFLTQWWARIW